MFPNCRLLLLDIDGTIAKENFTVTPKVKKSISKISKIIGVSLVSNRSQASVSRYMQDLKLVNSNFHIVEGGAKIIAGSGEIIRIQFLDSKILLKIINHLFKLGLTFNLCINGKSKIITSKKDINMADLKKITRLSILHLKNSQIKKIDDYLKKIKKINYFKAKSLSSPNLSNIDITDVKVEKGKAVICLRKLLKIEKKETVGVGDGFNDLPFILESGFKVAMGNAVAELKSVADYIAPSVENDGLVEVIKRITK